MQWHKGRVTDFGQVFDSMIERASGTHGRADGDAHADTPGECVEYPKECFCLVRGSILVDGHKNVVISEDGSDTEKGSEKVWDDVE